MKLFTMVHKETGILCREDGAVFIPDGRSRPRFKLHWTYGSTTVQGYKHIMYNRKTYIVHRLIAEAFLQNPDNKPTVDHINRNRADNWIYNLRWATSQEQRENSSPVINRVDYGVRERDDKKAYQKAYEATHREQINAWHREYRRKKREALNGK